MTRALHQEERDEVENLAYECETSPAKLRAYMTELIRLRSFAAAVKDCRARLPHSIERAIATYLTKPATLYQWLRLWQADQDPPPGNFP
jgi:hypothetical protein